MLVEFPDTLSFADTPSPVDPRDLTRIEIPDRHSAPAQLSPQEAERVKERLSRALAQLNIQYEFVRPQRSGWTSFEDGKEIYHGGAGTIDVNDQPK
jgi:hypothetical protein